MYSKFGQSGLFASELPVLIAENTIFDLFWYIGLRRVIVALLATCFSDIENIGGKPSSFKCQIRVAETM